MDVKVEFEKAVKLLSSQKEQLPFINDLLTDINNTLVAFFTSLDKSSPGSLRQNMLGIYRVEAELQSKQQHNSIDAAYNILLQRLEQTKQAHISITEFITDRRTYKVFSDFDRSELFGVIPSEVTLLEELEKVNKLRELIRMVGTHIEIDESRIKHLFRDGNYEGDMSDVGVKE